MGLFGGGKLRFMRPAPVSSLHRSLLDGLAPLRSDRIPPAYHPETISTYRPSWREWLSDKAGVFAENAFGAGRFARQDVEKKTGEALNFVPGVGAALAGNEARRAANRGDWIGAAGSLLGGAISAVPVGGVAARRVARKAETEATDILASRAAHLYDPPAKPIRDFASDYPGEAVADEAGRLLRDMDGRPLTARYVAGRTEAGAADAGLPVEAHEVIARAATGRGIEAVPPASLGRGVVGRTKLGRTGLPEKLSISQALSPSDFQRVSAHEIGHLIDQSVHEIPTAGLSRELSQVYNTLNTGRERTRNLTLPQHHGYRGEAIPREFIAEAIRGYMADPNYLKSVAPKTAARIRAYVNENPRLKDIIQFNSLSGASLGAGAAASGNAVDPDIPR